VYCVEDWAEIRRLHRAEEMPIKVIARVMGCSKNTVKAALASDGPPRYERSRAGSIVDEVEPRIREFSVDTPLAQTGACARIHLPSGWICELPDRHHGSCEFLHPEDIADAKKGFLDAWTGTWPQRT
jgi:hypothetical protein